MFVRTYFDLVGNQKDYTKLDSWLTAQFLSVAPVEGIIAYWKQDVRAVRVVSSIAVEQDEESAKVQINLCTDGVSGTNQPLVVVADLVVSHGRWQINKTTTIDPEAGMCD